MLRCTIKDKKGSAKPHSAGLSLLFYPCPTPIYPSIFSALDCIWSNHLCSRMPTLPHLPFIHHPPPAHIVPRVSLTDTTTHTHHATLVACVLILNHSIRNCCHVLFSLAVISVFLFVCPFARCVHNPHPCINNTPEVSDRIKTSPR
jgi:hypothetical protein